jgi:hypothetical protein
LTGPPPKSPEDPPCLRAGLRSIPLVLFLPPLQVQLSRERPHLLMCSSPPKPIIPIYRHLRSSPQPTASGVTKATLQYHPSHHSTPSRSPPMGATLQQPVLHMRLPWNGTGRGQGQKMGKALTSLSRTCLRHLRSSLPSHSRHALRSLPEHPRLWGRQNNRRHNRPNCHSALIPSREALRAVSPRTVPRRLPRPSRLA